MLFKHCEKHHGFDFIGTKKRLNMDFYTSMRVINYIRKMALGDENFARVSEFKIDGSEAFLNDDEFLKPTLEDDSLLYAIDELDLEVPREAQEPQVEGFDPPANDKERQLMEMVSALRHMHEIKVRDIQYMQEQFENYKTSIRSQFLADITDNLSLAGSEFDDRSVKSALGPKSHSKATSSDPYFDSYSSNEIHEIMLKDQVRTDGYRDFIYENKALFKDKIVLDVGCGTGILSMFAARAGAKKVYAVDNSEIVTKARENIKDNGLEDIITVVRGQIEYIDLPVKEVDIIISEWMGYFLLYEAMLDSVLVASKRFLKPDGLLAPSSSKIYLTAISDEEYMNDHVHYWNNVYGFKMSAMKGPIYSEALVEVVPAKSVVANHVELSSFDHHKVKIQDLDFVNPFDLVITKDCTVHALLGYFDIFFSASPQQSTPPKVDSYLPPHFNGSKKNRAEIVKSEPQIPLIHGFTTGPHGKPTHWRQVMFLFKNSIQAKAGDRIVGSFSCHKNSKNSRGLDFVVYYKVLSGDRNDTKDSTVDLSLPAVIASRDFTKETYRLH
ncbi:hypothetical protein H4219_000533 [Mycoemilia scoparia]|uniref:type I protein arginine methyltransferase n=1 Tax=Mycoemilia scoparia TaxID=417184 RepID=A0A9W8A991_9FUNG|nr:hypothetical protein H4219_000533 [Mycoemilia scoparia]